MEINTTMGCRCREKQLERMKNRDVIQEIANRYTETTGIQTVMVMKIVDGEEVYDFTEIRDIDNNLIEIQDEYGNKID